MHKKWSRLHCVKVCEKRERKDLLNAQEVITSALHHSLIQFAKQSWHSASMHEKWLASTASRSVGGKKKRPPQCTRSDPACTASRSVKEEKEKTSSMHVKWLACTVSKSVKNRESKDLLNAQEVIPPALRLNLEEKKEKVQMTPLGVQYREAWDDPKLGPSFPWPFSHLKQSAELWV